MQGVYVPFHSGKVVLMCCPLGEQLQSVTTIVSHFRSQIAIKPLPRLFFIQEKFFGIPPPSSPQEKAVSLTAV